MTFGRSMNRNYLKETLVGTALVIISLLVLSVIPEFDIGSFHYKRVSILSDIFKEKKKVAKKDVAVVKPHYVDTCKTGITCIEDFSSDTSGMNVFLAALDSAKNKKVRIAWFGDSYVEGDILLDPLRDTLQAIFGGSGVGFVPVTSEVAGFRQTIIHSFDNWSTYSIVGIRSSEHPLGPMGHTFVPDAGNKVLFTAEKRKRLDIFPTAKLFYGKAKNATANVNGVDYKLKSLSTINQISVGENLQSLKLHVEGDVDLYGLSLESVAGITVDNFSMRGNSGIGLMYVNEEMYREFDSIHHYDLVVLSYGLNVANEKAKNYNWYVRSMKPTIAMMKRVFPNSSIVVVACSDRAANVKGEYQTMPMLKELVEVQRKMAADNKVCFWNLFEAMGGDSTMVRWGSMKKNRLANKDYTHLTFLGGKKVAEIFLETILYEKEKYERRKKSR